MKKRFVGAAVAVVGMAGLGLNSCQKQLGFEESIRMEIANRLAYPIEPFSKTQPIPANARFMRIDALNITVPIVKHGQSANPTFFNDYCVLLNDPLVPGRVNRMPICASHIVKSTPR